jgi:hypothetical protein
MVLVTVDREADGSLLAHVGWNRDHAEAPPLEVLMLTALNAIFELGNEMWGGSSEVEVVGDGGELDRAARRRAARRRHA